MLAVHRTYSNTF